MPEHCFESVALTIDQMCVTFIGACFMNLSERDDCCHLDMTTERTDQINGHHLTTLHQFLALKKKPIAR